MKILLLIIGLLSTITTYAQQLGDWNFYLPTNSAISVALNDEGDIYCGTQNSYLFKVNQEDYSIDKLTKSVGLAQAEIQKVAYNSHHKLLTIAYQNADIDLWFEDELIYVPEIRIANLQGSKKINHIHYEGNLIYFSCDFGIVVYDLKKLEVRDTYFLGEGSSPIKVNNTKVYVNFIYAATENGLLKADVNHPNLSNSANWEVLYPEQVNEEVLSISSFGNSFYFATKSKLHKINGGNYSEVYTPEENYVISSVLANNGDIVLIEKQIDDAGNDANYGVVTFIDDNGNTLATINDNRIRRPQEIKADNKGNYWLADEWNTLLRITNKQAKEWIQPNGPASTSAHSLIYNDNTLWVTAGGVGRNGNFYLGKQAGIYKYNTGNWTNYNQWNEPLLSNVIDVVDIEPDPALNKVWVASYRSGLLEYEDGHFIAKYDQTNSIIKPALGDPGSSRIRGIKLDTDNNLWMCNHGAPDPILVKTPENEWIAMGGNLPTLDIADVNIDEQGNKWFSTVTAGIIVYNDNGTLQNLTDDDYVQYKTSNSELENNRITAIEFDKNGQAWIGTKEGVYVVYCPYATFGNGCPPTRPTIEDPETGELGYLLWYDYIRCIAIDAANRKWFGTTNGLWVFDADANKVIHNFNTGNSPLPDNDVESLCINDETGEVFIGTAKGIVSFRNEAIEGSITQNTDNVLVYPNPVRPDYEGKIAIKGLVNNAQVKVTDISGTLVHQTQALGGQAVWSGYLLNGKRAASGVYLIYSTNDDGQEKYAGKFMIIN